MRLSDRLMAAVHDYPAPAVPSAAVPWSQQTALQHWATLSLIIYHQGKTPRKLLLDDWNIDHVLADPPEVPLATFHFVAPEPGPTGWFDYRDVVKQVRQDAK